MVFRSFEAWDWMLTAINGVSFLNSSMCFDQTGGHEIFVLWDMPAPPWRLGNDDIFHPWKKALSFAIVTAGCHNQDDLGSLVAISSFLHSGHGLRYDTFRGAAAYADLTIGTMDLTSYIDKSKGLIVNCYDQAAGVATLGTLIGIPLQLRFMQPFGYINTVNLVGEGMCNNPFYNARGQEKIVGADDPLRTAFGNHAFTKYRNLIFDACAGPNLGSRNEAQYILETIDASTPQEAAFAGGEHNISTRSIIDLE